MPELPLMLRAALPSVPVVNQLPGIRKTKGELTGLTRSRDAVTIEREHVDRYAAVCGFPTKDTVPLPYPHLLAFELQMGIMTDPGFPAPAIGTVHLENSITQHRPLAVGETVGVTASVGPVPAAPQGHGLRLRHRGHRRRRDGLGGDLVLPAPRGRRARPTAATRRARQPSPTRPRAASSGSSRATSAAPTRASRATATRSTSTR